MSVDVLINDTVELLKNPENKANWMKIKTALIKDLPDYAKNVPYQIKSVSIKDACIAVREAKKKFKKTKQFNEVKFKSRKNSTQSIYIPKTALSIKGIYHTLLGKMKFKEELPNEIKDSRLICDNNHWYKIGRAHV